MARIEPSDLKIIGYFVCIVLSIFAKTSLILSFAPLELGGISGWVIDAYAYVRDLIFNGLGLWSAPSANILDFGIAYVLVGLAFSRIYVIESKPFGVGTSWSKYVIWALWPLSYMYFVPAITNLFDRQYAKAYEMDEAPVHNYGGEYRSYLFRKSLNHLVVVIAASVIFYALAWFESFLFG